MVDCGGCLVKYVLCMFNFAFFLAGTAVLALGIWLRVDMKSFITLITVVESEHIKQFTQPTVIEQGSYILIAAGAFMFVISFLGYCGAIRESKCLLTLYGISLVVILIMEITAGGLAAAYRGDAEMETKKVLKTSITKYYAPADKADAVTLAWNHVMAQLSCCGVDNYKDFNYSPKWASGNKTVPDACCVLEGNTSLIQVKYKNCPYSPSETNSYYEKGCYETLLNLVMTHRNLIIAVGIGLGLAQLLAIFFAFCLCKAIDGYMK